MRLSSAFIAGLVALAGAITFKAHELGQRSDEQIRAVYGRASEAETLTRGLLDRVHALRPPPYSLKGIDATTGSEVHLEAVDSLVVHLFNTTCSYCPENIPFLNRLSAAGVQVVAMSPDERRSFLEMYSRTHGTTFQLIAYPAGDVIDVLPTDAVPLTAVFMGGRLSTLWLGPLGQDRRQQLAERFGVHLDGT